MDAEAANQLKMKLMLALYFPYLYNPMRDLLRAHRLKPRRLSVITTTPTDRLNQFSRSNRDAQRQEDFIREELNKEWLPELHWFGYFYGAVSNVLHVINVITCAFLLFLPSSKSNDKDSPENLISTSYGPTISLVICQMPRFALQDYYDTTTVLWLSAFFSALHVSWRLIVILGKKAFIFNPVLFLMVDEEQLWMLVDVFTRPESPFYYWAPRDRGLKHPTIAMLFYTIYNKSNRQEIMYLRPNRTPKARIKLIETMKMGFKVSFNITISVCLVFLAVGLHAILFKINDFYTGCPQTGSQLVFLQRVLSSVFLLMVHVVDGIAALIVVPTLVLALASDLIYYWNYVKKELDSLLLSLLDARMSTPSRAEIYVDKTITRSYSARSSYLRRRLSRNNELSYSSQSSYMLNHSYKVNLAKRSYKIQMIVCDFFTQLGQANAFVQLMVNYAFVLWLSFNSIVTLTGLQSNTTYKIYIIRAIQVIALGILLGVSTLILGLKRETEAAYTTINSIMANDPTLDKTRWCLLLKYYTGRPRHAFTFLLSQLFTLGMLLKLLSYTITFTFFIRSIR